MTLTAQTKIGLTFGQVLSLIIVTSTFVMGYANLNLRIAELEVQKPVTEKAILQTNAEIERVRSENRQDHAIMFGKFDQIILNQRK